MLVFKIQASFTYLKIKDEPYRLITIVIHQFVAPGYLRHK